MLRVNNLVGFGAGASGRPTLAYKDYDRSTAATVTWPPVASGDLAVLFDCSKDTNTPMPTEVIPSGFTKIAGDTFESFLTIYMRLAVSYKICNGTESGSLTGMDDAQDGKILIIFSGGVSSVGFSTWDTEGTGGNPASQSVSASGETRPLIVFGVYCSHGSLPDFTTASPAFDGNLTNAASSDHVRVGYKIYNESPADHTIDATDGGDGNILATGYIYV